MSTGQLTRATEVHCHFSEFVCRMCVLACVCEKAGQRKKPGGGRGECERSGSVVLTGGVCVCGACV